MRSLALLIVDKFFVEFVLCCGAAGLCVFLYGVFAG